MVAGVTDYPIARLTTITLVRDLSHS